MNIYRIHPRLDAFEIVPGIFIPHLDIIAETEELAVLQAAIVMPGFNTEYSTNSLNYVELIGKH